MVVVVAFVAWQQLAPADEVTVETEVAGASVENVDAPEDEVVDVAAETPDTSTDEAVTSEVPDIPESDTTEEADAREPATPIANDEVNDPQETEAQPADNVDADEGLVTLSASVENLELVVYDVDPANGGNRSFAIRIVNDEAGESISTEGFAVQLETTDGERVGATVRFVHSEVPPGSSAIATVRAEGVPGGPLNAVLVRDGVDIDSTPLP